MITCSRAALAAAHSLTNRNSQLMQSLNFNAVSLTPARTVSFDNRSVYFSFGLHAANLAGHLEAQLVLLLTFAFDWLFMILTLD